MIVSKCVELRIKMKCMGEGEGFGVRCAAEHDANKCLRTGYAPDFLKFLVSVRLHCLASLLMYFHRDLASIDLRN
jgi:hypothetical protein